MEISSPLCITSRLLPGCRIGGACISIEYCSRSNWQRVDRQRYRWYIDLPAGITNGGGEFEGAKLTSGIGGGTLQEGLESLLCFLGAFAEAWELEAKGLSYDAENLNFFPTGLTQWAVDNVDAIAAMELELQEHPNKLIVE